MRDDEKVERLCETYEKCRKYLSGKNGEGSDMEDILQNAFMNAYIHLSQLREIGSLENWICVIGRNEERKYWKEKQKQYFTEEKIRKEIQPYCENTNRESDLIFIEDYILSYSELRELINGLSDIEKDIVYLHFKEGLKYIEISEITGCNYNTVRSTAMRLKPKLRAGIEKLQD